MKRFLRRAYRLIPFKREIFSLLKTFWKPSPQMYQHLHFKGTIRVPLEGYGKSIRMKHFGYQLENELFWSGIKGSPESSSLDLWMRLCERAGGIVDAGANTGLYALLASAVRPGARIIAFEPVKRVFERLVNNVQLNRFNIECVNKALSDYSGPGHYYDPMTEHLYSVTVNENLHADGVQAVRQPLETIMLDEFCAAHGIKSIDLMKIDVEMHEPQVLKGYKEGLRSHRPDMIVEVLTDKIADELDRMLNGLGYLYYDIPETSPPVRLERVMKSSGRNLLLCKQASAAYLKLA